MGEMEMIEYRTWPLLAFFAENDDFWEAISCNIGPLTGLHRYLQSTDQYLSADIKNTPTFHRHLIIPSTNMSHTSQCVHCDLAYFWQPISSPLSLQANPIYHFDQLDVLSKMAKYDVLTPFRSYDRASEVQGKTWSFPRQNRLAFTYLSLLNDFPYSDFHAILQVWHLYSLSITKTRLPEWSSRWSWSGFYSFRIGDYIPIPRSEFLHRSYAIFILKPWYLVES
jgi:hypothetical protein